MKERIVSIEKEKNSQNRRIWLKRALLGVPVLAGTAASLPFAMAVTGADNGEDLTLGEDNPTSKYGDDYHTVVNLHTSREFQIIGNVADFPGVSGMLTAQNSDSSINAVGLHAWSVGTAGIGIVCGIGLGGSKVGKALIADGRIGVGTYSPGAMIHIDAGTSNPILAQGSPGAGPAPTAFIVENLTSGNFKNQFTFKGGGANKYSFGNDMGGIGAQNFYIWDEVGAQTALYIDSSRRVGLGTTAPTEKLHVIGNVKAASFITGDIAFANDFIVTEDESIGLAFKNDSGEKIAVLDRQGNIHIKGKVLEDL